MCIIGGTNPSFQGRTYVECGCQEESKWSWEKAGHLKWTYVDIYILHILASVHNVKGISASNQNSDQSLLFSLSSSLFTYSTLTSPLLSAKRTTTKTAISNPPSPLKNHTKKSNGTEHLELKKEVFTPPTPTPSHAPQPPAPSPPSAHTSPHSPPPSPASDDQPPPPTRSSAPSHTAHTPD